MYRCSHLLVHRCRYRYRYRYTSRPLPLPPTTTTTTHHPIMASWPFPIPGPSLILHHPPPPPNLQSLLFTYLPVCVATGNMQLCFSASKGVGFILESSSRHCSISCWLYYLPRPRCVHSHRCCGTVVARVTRNDEVPGSIPGSSSFEVFEVCLPSLPRVSAPTARSFAGRECTTNTMTNSMMNSTHIE